MKIQHMRKQWIPGSSFFFPARSAPRASLRAKKEGLGTRLVTFVLGRTVMAPVLTACYCAGFIGGLSAIVHSIVLVSPVAPIIHGSQ